MFVGEFLHQATAWPSCGILQDPSGESRHKVMLGLPTSASSDSSVLALHRQLLSKSSDVSASQGIRNGHPSTTTKDKMIPRRPWYYVCKKPTHDLDNCWKYMASPRTESPQENAVHILPLSLTSPLQSPSPLQRNNLNYFTNHLDGKWQPSPSSPSVFGTGMLQFKVIFPLLHYHRMIFHIIG